MYHLPAIPRYLAPVVPAAAPASPVQANVQAAVQAEELLERRRFNRAIPAPQVIACDDEESWELWSQWSAL